MVHAFQMDVPISQEIYDQIRAELGSDVPQGLIMHLMIQQPQGLRYIEVWESAEDWDRFAEERLHPVVGRILAQAGMGAPVEPHQQPLDVRDVWGASSIARV